MPLQFIADRKHILPSKLFAINIDGHKVILLDHNGSVKAYQGDCPHEGADLAQGHIEAGYIICPMHQRHFSCQTGKHNASDQCLKRYPITEKEGQILIDTKDLSDIEATQKPSHKIKTIKDLPSPKGNFLLGHITQFRGPDTHLVLERWVRERGELFQINFAGKKLIVSANTEMNRQILKNRPQAFRRFSKINEVMEEMGVVGTFNAEGETWLKHRKLTAEALNFKNTKNYFSTVALITGRLLKRWKTFASLNKQVDAQKELMRYTVDITTAIAFGHDTNTLEKEDDIIQKHLEKIFPMVNKRVSSPIPFWRFIKSKSDKELDAALARIKATIDGFIADAKERLEKQAALTDNPTNFLEALLVEQQKEGGLSNKEIYGNVFTILLAGEDTTSNSISWILYYLALHPEAVEKVRQEVDLLCADRDFPDSFDIASALEYTDAVAQEAMRLKPVTPTLYMEALEDTEINGLLIEKGMPVVLQNKVGHTAEKNFVEQDKFIPERWINGKCPFTGAHVPEAILTFGSGPRFCPGKNLAMLEMVMATAMICKNFDFTLAVPAEDVKEVFAFTMFPDNLMLKLGIRH
jgi:cytochrome P450/nitrite reductase/ring-hydroxylating ferredoxin subunit